MSGWELCSFDPRTGYSSGSMSPVYYGWSLPGDFDTGRLSFCLLARVMNVGGSPILTGPRITPPGVGRSREAPETIQPTSQQVPLLTPVSYPAERTTLFAGTARAVLRLEGR